MLGILIAASVAVRVIYFVQFNATPVIEMHQWAQTDMHYYDGWARQIAAGDWLSASVRVPMHRWHREIADQYFATHPGTREKMQLESQRTSGHPDPETLVWSGWMRAPQFYQDPLYAYMVALTYRLTGSDVRHVFAWQLALGVLSTVLLWGLSVRFFGDAVAAVAGSLALLCAPMLSYEMLLLRDSVIVFASLLLIWLADRAMTSGGWVRFGVLGLALGLSCLLKSTFVLLAGGVIAGTMVGAGGRWPRRLVQAGALTAGLLIALAPLMARNVRVGAAPLSLASSGPLTFVASNEGSYLPDVGFGIDTRLLAGFLGDTDGGWISAMRIVRQSQTASGYAEMVWRKWDRVWHWFEIPNNENFYYLRLRVPLLSWLPVTFWVCSPLALVGLVLAFRRVRQVWPLYLLVTTCLAPLLLFYVLGRFRMPLAAAFLIFAAVTIVEIVKRLAARHYATALVAAGSVALVASWTGRPLAADQVQIRMADWILPYSVFYQSRVYDALDARDYSRAGAWYVAFFKYEPTADQIAASGDPSLAPELADMHRECASILRVAGEPGLAQAELEQADRLTHLRGIP